MERKDFIEQVGLSAASILIFGCMQGCSKSESPAPTPPPSNNNNPPKAIDFTINITTNPYTSLNTAGGFYVDKANNIIIARTLTDEFLAVSSLCTHQQVLLDGGVVGAGLSDLEHPCMQPKINIEAALRPTCSIKSFLSIIINFYDK